MGKKIIKTTKSGAKVPYLHMYMEIIMYDVDELKAELKKKKGAKTSKIATIYRKHQVSVARVELFPSSDFIGIALKDDYGLFGAKRDYGVGLGSPFSRGRSTQVMKEEIMNDVYTKDCFYTYELGFLQNYFQKINNLIVKEEVYWMYEDDYTSELKKLTKETLYVPSYMEIMFNPFKRLDSDERKKAVIKTFDEYAYTYKFQEDAVINERILNGEEFYYLRYARVNSQKFIHIINSKTGEIIYRNYKTGFAYNLKGKHLKELNKTIKKSLKK